MRIVEFVIGFIVIAIVMNLGMFILAGTSSDCSSVGDYDETLDPDKQIGWAETCYDQGVAIQAAWVLLNIIYVVLVAVIILNAIGMLNIGGS